MAFACGTEHRYRQHIARGETTDQACKTAHAEYQRLYTRSPGRLARMARAQRVRRKAVLMLIEKFPDEFQELLKESEKVETEDEIIAMMNEITDERNK